MAKDVELKLTKEIDKAIRDLKLIIFNLEIESAHLTEPNGIGVISEELMRIIDRMENEIQELMKDIGKE